MKGSLNITVTLLILLVGQLTYSQDVIERLKNDKTKLYVEYADYKGYSNDSTFTSITKTSLFIGELGAIYLYKITTIEEFLDDMKRSIRVREGKTLDTNAFMSSYKQSVDIEKNISVVYAKYYSSPDYLNMKKFSDGDVWLSDTVKYNWQIVNDFKIVHGYRCQKAIYVNSRGQEYSAWFTEEIPISTGPLYLTGLPGLILEFYNLSAKRAFKATVITSTDIPEQHFRRWLTGPIVSKSEYRVMYDNNSRNIDQIMRMMDVKKD